MLALKARLSTATHNRIFLRFVVRGSVEIILIESCLSPESSPAYQLRMEFRITSPFELDLRRSVFEGAHVLSGQFNLRRSKILFQASQLRCARNRNDPGLFREQPAERDSRRSRLLLFCERDHEVNQGLICFTILGAESGYDVAKIRAVELRVGIDLACQEAFAKGTEGNEANPQFLKGWHHRLFRFPPK